MSQNHTAYYDCLHSQLLQVFSEVLSRIANLWKRLNYPRHRILDIITEGPPVFTAGSKALKKLMNEPIDTKWICIHTLINSIMCRAPEVAALSGGFQSDEAATSFKRASETSPVWARIALPFVLNMAGGVRRGDRRGWMWYVGEKCLEVKAVL
jgi:fructose-bisphosphate aldolase class 1